MPSVFHILCCSIIGLQCFFLHIRILIVAIVALIPVDITCSPVTPLEYSEGPSPLAGGGDGIALGGFVNIIFVIRSFFRVPLSSSHLCLPQMQWTKCCFAA